MSRFCNCVGCVNIRSQKHPMCISYCAGAPHFRKEESSGILAYSSSWSTSYTWVTCRSCPHLYSMASSWPYWVRYKVTAFDRPKMRYLFKLKSKSGKMKAEVRFKITIPSNPNYNPLTERRKSESNISSGPKHGKNIKDGVWNSFNLETVSAESYDEPDAEPYSQQKSNQSSPLVHPRVSDTRRHTIADLDQNVSLTDLPMVKRRDSIRRKPKFLF